MTALDAGIDELYRLPLAEFTPARNALAKTLKGDDAARVKRLEKPALAAWAVNQLYWRERRTYDRLMAAGGALRVAQLGALTGASTDLRRATADHREVMAIALSTATQVAAQSGARPAQEQLSRMLEALSLAPEPPAHPGRQVAVVQLAGFEALAGVAPLARLQAAASPSPARVGAPEGSPRESAAAARQRAQEHEARRRAAEAEVRAATGKLDQAAGEETRAQALVEASRQQLARAESALRSAVTQVAQARIRRADAEAALALTLSRRLDSV